MNYIKLISSIATSVSCKALTQILQSVGRVAISTVVALVVFASPTTAETYFYHNDHLGTPQALTDGDQSIVWHAEYDPFGKATETVETIEQNLRFPGQYLDRETGLHYNYFRTYDPSTGRYTQSDPIGLGGGINTYGYAYQNPQSYTDPTGLFVPLVIPGICAAGACEAIFVAAGATAIWWGTNNPWSTDLDEVSFPDIYNSESDSSNACPIPGASPGRETKGRTTLWEKEGNMSDADIDFDNLNPVNVKPIPGGGRVGTLPDGRNINVRPTSTDGRPTIEIQSGKKRDKIRYGQP